MGEIIFCSKCGARCSTKMKIQARKNKDYIFCSSCFDMVRNLTMKKIRVEIRKVKVY